MIHLKTVNKEVQKVNQNLELERGEGYFYFIYDDGKNYFTESVYVNSLNQLTLEQWIEEATAVMFTISDQM